MRSTLLHYACLLKMDAYARMKKSAVAAMSALVHFGLSINFNDKSPVNNFCILDRYKYAHFIR